MGGAQQSEFTVVTPRKFRDKPPIDLCAIQRRIAPRRRAAERPQAWLKSTNCQAATADRSRDCRRRISQFTMSECHCLPAPVGCVTSAMAGRSRRRAPLPFRPRRRTRFRAESATSFHLPSSRRSRTCRSIKAPRNLASPPHRHRARTRSIDWGAPGPPMAFS